MNVRQVTIPYKPRAQFLGFHKRHQRFCVGVAHRRAGKTVATINDLLRDAAMSKVPNYRGGFVAPYLSQGKAVAWEYLKHYSFDLWGKPPNEAELTITLLNGAKLRIHGSDNPNALRGGYFDNVVLDEFADISPQMWGEIIRPMIADREGRATFIGTPRGKNHFYELFRNAKIDRDWFWFQLKASETGLIPESELQLARLAMTPEQYEQEFECSFEAAVAGSYWRNELAALERAGRVKEGILDPSLPVHTAWDLGIGDSTAIWCFQAAGSELRIVDFYENNGFALDHYCNWLCDRGFMGGVDWVPHDARVRELGTGKTRVESLSSLRRNPRLVPSATLEDGINAVRMTLPYAWFDAKLVKPFEKLRMYKEAQSRLTHLPLGHPLHDENSHAADAFRYLCLAWRKISKPEEPALPRLRGLGETTFGELIEEDERQMSRW